VQLASSLLNPLKSSCEARESEDDSSGLMRKGGGSLPSLPSSSLNSAAKRTSSPRRALCHLQLPPSDSKSALSDKESRKNAESEARKESIEGSKGRQSGGSASTPH
jgi:hypothetical protein